MIRLTSSQRFGPRRPVPQAAPAPGRQRLRKEDSSLGACRDVSADCQNSLASGCGRAFEWDVVEMGHLFEGLEPLIDLRVFQSVNSLRTELFYIERCHDRAVDHCSTKRRIRDLGLGRKVTHKTARESVARTCGVKYALERVRGDSEIT